MTYTIAIIPAKSYSRRLPNKNFRKLNKKHLFEYSIDFAKGSPQINEIFVSSDSDDILRISKKKNVSVFKRSRLLCNDNIKNFDVLLHHYNELKISNKKPEIIALIQPTTPFRESEDLTYMLSKFKEEKKADSLITLKEIKRSRGKLFGKYWVKNNSIDNNSKNLQSSKEYEATGHLILLRPENTLEKNSILGKNILGEKLPTNWPDIDIDTSEDWEDAERFIRRGI